MVSFNGHLNLTAIKSKKPLPYSPQKINFKSSKVDKEGYDHFMLKEIAENPYVINQVILQDGKVYDRFIKAIQKAENIYVIAVGTAGGAASQIAFYLRIHAKIKAMGLTAADCLDYVDLFTPKDLIITPSQSGESADVLEVLEKAKEKGVKIATLVNMPGSTMTRMSDFKFMSNAGPEICVMSTKVYTSQIAWGYLLSKVVSGKQAEGRTNLKSLAREVEKYLNTKSNHDLIKNLAKELAKKQHIF